MYCQRMKFNVFVEIQCIFEIIVGEIIVKSPYKLLWRGSKPKPPETFAPPEILCSILLSSGTLPEIVRSDLTHNNNDNNNNKHNVNNNNNDNNNSINNSTSNNSNSSNNNSKYYLSLTAGPG